MRFVPILFAIAVLCQGCSTIHGREETVEFSQRCLRPPKLLMYCGSDMRWHHFIARPVDSYVFFKIDRRELSLDDERPYTGDNLNYYYAVDPARAFAKVPD